MQLKQDFLINRPADEVWSFFHDIPALAECLPGAEYIGPTEDGRHSGKLTSKIGPFQASFAGEASVTYDEAARTIALVGSPGEVADRIAEISAILGTDTHLVVFDMGGLPDGELRATIERFGRDVIPQLS